MKRESLRTFAVLAGLLAIIAAGQFVAWTPVAGAAMVWLDDDPNEPVDPNQVEDPNTVDDPQPEYASLVPWVCLDEEPVDPNAPEADPEPLPESALAPAVRNP